MIIFHGGCIGCTRQQTKPIEYCMDCQYFAADWTLPSLSNEPPTEAELIRAYLQAHREDLLWEELKRKPK
jgi:hypothetical protein